MLIGHEKIVNDLKRLAREEKLSHGYIFFGPAMVGKRTVALQLATSFEAGEPTKSPDEARSKILQDLLLLQPDEKGTIGIDAARSLKNFLWQKPNISPRRTAILDGVEYMTTEAQNALLKIAEEPPPSTLLILITADIESVNATISSRLQKINFSPAKKKDISEWLVNEVGLAKKGAADFAGRAGGRPGLAYALAKDKTFQKNMENAEKLFKAPPASRRDIIKKLIEPDDFSLANFMDFLILSLASANFKNKVDARRWHKFLELRRNAAYYNLNPRLQLENLLQ